MMAINTHDEERMEGLVFKQLMLFKQPNVIQKFEKTDDL